MQCALKKFTEKSSNFAVVVVSGGGGGRRRRRRGGGDGGGGATDATYFNNININPVNTKTSLNYTFFPP